jgi:radical SAM protein with 4Fe4S-binding SPASM domain
MVILSGGEPLLRPDILDLASLGSSLGLRMLLSTNGTLLCSSLAKKIKKAGVARLSLSLDAPEATAHDVFRGQPGAFESTVNGALILREEGLPFQINTTLTAANVDKIGAISDLTLKLGAAAHHVFLLVPVGRAQNWEEQRLSPESYERLLIELRRREEFTKLEFKATCAPQYNRVGLELALPPNPRSGRGCLGGQGFMFVARDGQVGACGYLPLPAGNVLKEHPIDIYNNSALFKELRSKSSYSGGCGECEYFNICGGCRARAHATGDYLGDDPLCLHSRRTEGKH